MEDKNMTAIMSLFVRVYHYRNSNIKVYNDKYSNVIMSDSEYNSIWNNLYSGIKFFNSNFEGNETDAIKWIVNKQIGPSVLGRSAFNKRVLDNEILLGCKEYIIFASGYDTSSFDYNIKCFEIDKFDVIRNKVNRVNNIKKSNIKYIEGDLSEYGWIKDLEVNGYDKKVKSHSSLLGLSYYLSKDDFNKLIGNISDIISIGSSIVFDFQTLDESDETKKNEILASGANQVMKSKYSYEEMEEILSSNKFRIYEYLDDKQINKEFFYDYNTLNPFCTMVAPKGVAYILAVKL